MDIRIAGRFRVGRRIGGGSFGTLYLGLDCNTMEVVAIKLEKTSTQYPQLVMESKVYQIVHGSQGAVGFPTVKYSGTEGEFNVLVMDLIGPSVEELFSYCKKKFSLPTTLILAEQMLQRIEHLHNNHLLHRDLKPDNFALGPVKQNRTVFLIDFGLSKRYRHPGTLRHIPYVEGKNMTGTARYASINAHLGYEQSRRDDLEALGYVLVYLAKGNLPWQGLKIQEKKGNAKYEEISKMKQETSVWELCRGLPTEFVTYLLDVKQLTFEQEPDYRKLYGLLATALANENATPDTPLDWETRRSEERENFFALY